jgi:hypothetical protein
MPTRFELCVRVVILRKGEKERFNGASNSMYLTEFSSTIKSAIKWKTSILPLEFDSQGFDIVAEESAGVTKIMPMMSVCS